MIDTADLQSFLSKIEGGAAAVDLLKIGENNHQQYAGKLINTGLQLSIFFENI